MFKYFLLWAIESWAQLIAVAMIAYMALGDGSIFAALGLSGLALYFAIDAALWAYLAFKKAHDVALAGYFRASPAAFILVALFYLPMLPAPYDPAEKMALHVMAAGLFLADSIIKHVTTTKGMAKQGR